MESPAMTRVLLVEDDPSISDPLAHLLSSEGFDVIIADNGPEALDRFDDLDPDLVLLDVQIPGLSGLEVCRRIRHRSAVPIIILTARDSETDKVNGLALGADDYLTKPFSFRELLARMRAVLRRNHHIGDLAPDLTPDVMEAGDVRIDLLRHQVTVRGAPVALSLAAFTLLATLMRNRGRVVSREELVDQLCGVDANVDRKTVETPILRLRRKIERNPAHPRHLKTVRGLGYIFDP